MMIFVMLVGLIGLMLKKNMLEIIIFLEVLVFLYMMLILFCSNHNVFIILIMIISVCEAIAGLVLIIKTVKKSKSSSIHKLNLGKQ